MIDSVGHVPIRESALLRGLIVTRFHRDRVAHEILDYDHKAPLLARESINPDIIDPCTV